MRRTQPRDERNVVPGVVILPVLPYRLGRSSWVGRVCLVCSVERIKYALVGWRRSTADTQGAIGDARAAWHCRTQPAQSTTRHLCPMAGDAIRFVSRKTFLLFGDFPRPDLEHTLRVGSLACCRAGLLLREAHGTGTTQFLSSVVLTGAHRGDHRRFRFLHSPRTAGHPYSIA